MEKFKIMHTPVFKPERGMQFQQGSTCIRFKIPECMIEIEKQVTVFDFRFQIADFRFANGLLIKSAPKGRLWCNLQSLHDRLKSIIFR